MRKVLSIKLCFTNPLSIHSILVKGQRGYAIKYIKKKTTPKKSRQKNEQTFHRG